MLQFKAKLESFIPTLFRPIGSNSVYITEANGICDADAVWLQSPERNVGRPERESRRITESRSCFPVDVLEQQRDAVTSKLHGSIVL